MTTPVDPRAAGWVMRLAPACLLRPGDIVLHTGVERRVATAVQMGNMTRVVYHDGTEHYYPPEYQPVRWRAPR